MNVFNANKDDMSGKSFCFNLEHSSETKRIEKSKNRVNKMSSTTRVVEIALIRNRLGTH